MVHNFFFLVLCSIIADKRSISPFTVLRSRSVPSQTKEKTQSTENLSLTMDANVRNSFPGEFVRETRTDTNVSDTSADHSNLSNVSSGIIDVFVVVEK